MLNILLYKCDIYHIKYILVFVCICIYLSLDLRYFLSISFSLVHYYLFTYIELISISSIVSRPFLYLALSYRCIIFPYFVDTFSIFTFIAATFYIFTYSQTFYLCLLRRRFLKKPNIAEASQQYADLANTFVNEECFNYAAICLISKAKLVAMGIHAAS